MNKKEFVKDQFAFFSSHYWREAQKLSGSNNFTVALKDGLEVSIYKNRLFKDLFYYYIPRGPLMRGTESEQESTINQILGRLPKDKKVIFLRFEPIILDGLPHIKGTISCNKNSPLSSQCSPNQTSVINLLNTEESILAQMKPKGRYNIKVATKNKVTVQKTLSISDIDIFWNLLQELEDRGEYKGHTKDYYINLLQSLTKAKKGALFIGYYNNRPVCAIIVGYSNKSAIYLHGASSRVHKNVMAPYLVQWEAIKDAKKEGYSFYDFWGISPDGSAKDHPWKKITDFKLKFGGERVVFYGTFDIALSYKYYLLKGINFLRKIWKKY
jgi:peptidoglycan pentaglycine glycine transferase (the first glycine)